MKGNAQSKLFKPIKKIISKFFGEYFFGLILLVIAIMWYCKNLQIQHFGKYGIATTKYEIPSRKNKSIYYEFRAENGKLYEGVIRKNTSKIKCPNGEYLVIYSTNNPTINILVDNKEVTTEIDLDSLKSLTIDPKDWMWKEL